MKFGLFTELVFDLDTQMVSKNFDKLDDLLHRYGRAGKQLRERSTDQDAYLPGERWSNRERRRPQLIIRSPRIGRPICPTLKYPPGLAAPSHNCRMR